jgi:hypothetical protein
LTIFGGNDNTVLIENDRAVIVRSAKFDSLDEKNSSPTTVDEIQDNLVLRDKIRVRRMLGVRDFLPESRRRYT